jgi:hypothetical protein
MFSVWCIFTKKCRNRSQNTQRDKKGAWERERGGENERNTKINQIKGDNIYI